MNIWNDKSRTHLVLSSFCSYSTKSSKEPEHLKVYEHYIHHYPIVLEPYIPFHVKDKVDWLDGVWEEAKEILNIYSNITLHEMGFYNE